MYLHVHKESPCLECMPFIFPENVNPLRIYRLVEDQVITAGMAGVIIGLKQEPIWMAIDRYRTRLHITDDLECFEKVRTIFFKILELQRLENAD